MPFLSFPFLFPHTRNIFIECIYWSRGSLYSATKIVHDCMASLSPVGIASLFHHHSQPKLHDIVWCIYGYFLVFPKKLPGEMKYDCNKDVFSMKFACFLKFHVMYSLVHNMWSMLLIR
jgi:hypothetical protein